MGSNKRTSAVTTQEQCMAMKHRYMQNNIPD